MQRLRIAAPHLQQMAAHAAACSPLEACGLVAAGLVAGRPAASLQVFEITNELGSPTHFSMAPAEQLQAFMEIEAKGWDLLAIYHSHPAGPPTPSRTDVAEARYPGVAHIIWAPGADGTWACRAFLLDGGEVREIELEIDTESDGRLVP